MAPRIIWLIVVLLSVAAPPALAASDYQGRVLAGEVPVPGAKVTATRGDIVLTTITDLEGQYRFEGLAEGTWTIAIAQAGFETLTFEVTIPPPDGSPPVSQLTMLPLERIVRHVPEPQPATAAAASDPGSQATPAAAAAFQRAGVSQVATAAPAPQEEAPADPTGIGAAAGLLINGSMSNGASTPFAQPRGFGTNRPGQRSLYTGAMGLQFGNSAWDASPYSFTGQRVARPSYNDTQFLGTFQGPFSIPGVRNRLQVFAGYQGSTGYNAISASARMPTERERAGDFSHSLDAAGQPIAIVDPETGQPFADARIPADRISPQAAALLAYYPLPNGGEGARFNHQVPLVTRTRQDSVQTRLTQSPSARHQLTGALSYGRSTPVSTSLFDFESRQRSSNVDAQLTWSYRASQFLTFRSRYGYARQRSTTEPFFAHRINVSGDAGIAGNDQDPANWGPPTLQFASGLAGLADARYARTRTATQTWASEGLSYRGRHTVTFGGEVRRHATDIVGQQDPRGTFTFTGAATGSDFADFLLGLPQTSAIAFGNADKGFRNGSYALYVTDDWRVGPTLTLNAGVRWEYESPITERLGRLVNLDVAPGFTAVAPVVASDPSGALTGTAYPSSLLIPDRSGIQPRLGLAWRPVAGSSLVVRAGYGLYRNTNVYQSIAMVLAQQPPLSTAFSVATSEARPLTLADGFLIDGDGALNTFAIDPDFRVGFAQNWQASVQRDLPQSLTVIATYLGARGHRLMQQFVPNTYPAGADNPCAACPTGFRYLTSGGRSLRNALQVQLRRRLRNGFTASAQYTLAKAMDNAAAFGGASLDGVALAQDWLDLEAEYAPSSFDQRHQLVTQVEYTTGAGIMGGTLVDGWKGRLFKDWTLAAQLATGSGSPLTPVVFGPVAGTGIIGGTRPSLTGAPVEAEGFYANPAAYAAPAAGEWGNAGRNSIVGPRPFSLNASIARTFRATERMSLDWRIDATNVTNRVTYAGVDVLVGSPQFGLPNRTADMRRVRSLLRVRF
jgi:outer membrane receptor protein involved in Fe transport